MTHPQEQFMHQALAEARLALEQGQYPIGAAIIYENEVLVRAHTTIHETQDPTAHAEINAIRLASQKRGTRYLTGAWLYTTHEPCPMCTAAAIWAKLDGIVYGVAMTDTVARGRTQTTGRSLSWRQITIRARDVIAAGQPRLQLYEDFMAPECHEFGSRKGLPG